MAKKTSTIPTLTASGRTKPTPGLSFIVHERGTDSYERLRLGGEVDVTFGDESIVRCTVLSRTAGTLIELLGGQGNGQAYPGIFQPGMGAMADPPLTVVQTLTDAAIEDVLDVTKLYTAITLSLPQPVPPSPSPSPFPLTA